MGWLGGNSCVPTIELYYVFFSCTYPTVPLTTQPTTDKLCECLGQPRSGGNLSSLTLKGCGIADLNVAAIMEVVAGNTVLTALDASGNDVGGTSDLLATTIHTKADGDEEDRRVRESSRHPPRTHC